MFAFSGRWANRARAGNGGLQAKPRTHTIGHELALVPNENHVGNGWSQATADVAQRHARDRETIPEPALRRLETLPRTATEVNISSLTVRNGGIDLKRTLRRAAQWACGMRSAYRAGSLAHENASPAFADSARAELLVGKGHLNVSSTRRYSFAAW